MDICNVLHIWHIRAIPTYRVYRLYDVLIHTADCGVPVSNATLNYSSTLEGSVLILTCENDTSTDEQALNVTCHSNGSWIPDPANFTCSSLKFYFNNTTAPSGMDIVKLIIRRGRECRTRYNIPV